MSLELRIPRKITGGYVVWSGLALLPICLISTSSHCRRETPFVLTLKNDRKDVCSLSPPLMQGTNLIE
jgi:hypothetical protein